MAEDRGVGGDEWIGRTGRAWAEEWRRTDRSFGPLTERLLARSREVDFSGALDVGCGAGELSLALARGRPQARIVGVDVSPPLIEAARERGAHLRNAAFACADAASWWPADGFVPELLVSRHGVMFFDDPTGAFAHLASIAAEGCHLLFSCFRDRAENPVFAEVARLLPPPPEPPAADAPGPFAFADSARVENVLREGGWSAIDFERFDFGMVIGAGDDPVADALGYFSRIGPAARALSEMAGGEREPLLEALGDLARRSLHHGMVIMRAAAWIVTARRG